MDDELSIRRRQRAGSASRKRVELLQTLLYGGHLSNIDELCLALRDCSDVEVGTAFRDLIVDQAKTMDPERIGRIMRAMTLRLQADPSWQQVLESFLSQPHRKPD